MIKVYDNVLDSDTQLRLWNHLKGPGWSYGALSNQDDRFRYWYKEFTHSLEQDQIIHNVWQLIHRQFLQEHKIHRCYANGYPYGAEGTLHVDVLGTGPHINQCFTALYYPHMDWSPDYGGETVFFNEGRDEIICSIYPKPNRLVLFSAALPHVARGVTRSCPHLRVTLMFKTIFSGDKQT